MRTYVTNYYRDFKCIGSSCTHNCCIGWEIDIDSETHKKYMGIKGDLGEKIRNSISDSDTPHFITGNDGRCPLLDENNLCRIIKELGEENLCQICADHPRYKNYLSGRMEMGLGMCCEVAAKLILTQKEKAEFIPLNDDGENSDDKDFLDYRESILNILQNRTVPLDARIKNLNIPIPSLTFNELFEIYSDLERLDDAWENSLSYIKNLSSINENLFKDEKWQFAFEQLIVYFIHRHLYNGFCDFRKDSVILFAILSTKLLAGICTGFYNEHGKLTIEDFISFAREYSAEIEYSDENMEKLFEISN